MTKIILFIFMLFVSTHAQMTCNTILKEIESIEKNQKRALESGFNTEAFIAASMAFALCDDEDVYPEPTQRVEKCKFSDFKSKNELDVNSYERLQFLRLKLKNCLPY